MGSNLWELSDSYFLSLEQKLAVCATVPKGPYVCQTCPSSNLACLPGSIRNMSLETLAFYGILGLNLGCLWGCYEDLLQYN